MKRAREPTEEKNKEKAFIMWLQLGGNNSPKGTLTKIAKALGVSSGTVRGWKSREKWDSKCNVANSTTVTLGDVVESQKENNKKHNIIKANEMYLAGTNANKIAKELGVNASTVCRWISRYKWKETRERLLIKVTDILFNKYKKERLKERESSYKYAGLIRALAIQKITGKEYSIGEDGEKKLIPRMRGKYLAAEISALTMAMKLIEDTNNFQDRMLGINNMDNLLANIVDEYNRNIDKEFETKKFILSSELKLLEIENKYNNGDNEDQKDNSEDYDITLDEWTKEAWKNEE